MANITTWLSSNMASANATWNTATLVKPSQTLAPEAARGVPVRRGSEHTLVLAECTRFAPTLPRPQHRLKRHTCCAAEPQPLQGREGARVSCQISRWEGRVGIQESDELWNTWVVKR